MKGTSVCRSHGGRGALTKNYVPGFISLTPQEQQTLKEMMAEDDMTLKREFHVLRLFFEKAMVQFKQVNPAIEDSSTSDAIGELRRLAAIVDRLSSIAEKRIKVMTSAPKSEAEVVLRWEDPRLQYHIKEKLREMHYYTIRLILALVIHYVDPDGTVGIVKRLPSSLTPFLPQTSTSNETEPLKTG